MKLLFPVSTVVPLSVTLVAVFIPLLPDLCILPIQSVPFRPGFT
jgi:hypothetical protein